MERHGGGGNSGDGGGGNINRDRNNTTNNNNHKHNHDRNPDGLISAAEAWLIIAAREFQGARPGPILIEIPCLAEDRNRVNAAERRAYSTHGPWDGQIMVVVTGGGHTEPVWWEKDGVRLAKVPVDRQALPPVVTISGDLGVAGLFAMYYRLSMRWRSRRMRCSRTIARRGDGFAW